MNDKFRDLIKKWRRTRMEYYFIFSLILAMLLIVSNLFFIRKYF